MLIKAYGLFWNPEIVEWGKRGPGNRGHLVGTVRKKGREHEIDFWEAYGIYVLHDNFAAIYVGKASDTRMGPRLRSHLTDRFAGRWDMFSWYSLSGVNTTSHDVRDPGARQVTESVLNNTLEALCILIADPPLNRKRERIPSALESQQAKNPHPRTVRNYLEDILAKLEDTDR